MAEFAVQALGDGWYDVTDAEKRWRVAVASDGDRTWVFVDGQVARLEPTAKAGARKRAQGRTESGVMSPMPATVVALNVAIGQAVARGDTLVVLEAMKMEVPIRAPRDGVVKSILCAKGELVQSGVNLLEFE